MKKEMNNKGFSLVELIIVIAIMAILIVVLAPQYLKYVERSRNSTDLQNATEMVTAIQTFAADPEVGDKAFVKGAKFEITVGNTTSITDTAAGSVAAALSNAAIDASAINCKSKTKWTQYVIKGEVATDGNIVFDYDNADFKNAMSGKSGT